MIIFKELRWSNIFSYGDNNSLRLDASRLTQLTGKNGHGKSSIALILEEVLFNQNSKKLKRSDILNRHTDGGKYSIELDFEKDSDEYTIKTSRVGATSTVRVLCNGKDISAHTATGSYKTIENILGFDYKTFSQIVYQSSPASLEFLTATDTARKKFLIDLLNLGVYTKALDVFKELASGKTKLVESLQTKINTVTSWLQKLEKEDLTVKPIEPVPERFTDQEAKLVLLKNSLLNIESTNKKIANNNKYKEIVDGIELDANAPKSGVDDDLILQANIAIANVKKELAAGAALTNKVHGPTRTCTSCGTVISDEHNYKLCKDFEAVKPEKEFVLKGYQTVLNTLLSNRDKYNKEQEKILELEKYHSLIDHSLGSELLDRGIIKSEIDMLELSIKTNASAIARVIAANKVNADHNTKVAVLLGQKKDMLADQLEYSNSLLIATKELSELQILVKAFGTTGLVAYKIECLVKDLEELTNEYLLSLSDGRFQLSFKVSSTDKLNVIITDNGDDVDILALSNGERARVNVATLLAIRKLMQSLSNSRTNLLILDETIENLDVGGKERLIEILLQEENLNTFLISHGFSHPLLEKVSVLKENNISRIEK